eukprot:5676415-Alexandrium_andersonii.AAC.1
MATLGWLAGAMILEQIWHTKSRAPCTMSALAPESVRSRAKRSLEGWQRRPWHLAMKFREAFGS